MSSGKCVVVLILTITLTLVAGNAYSNGINPPRPSGADVVKAVCEESSGGRELEVFRARMMSGPDPVEGLTFAIGNVKEQINIRDIKAITVNAATSDSEGFVQGSLLRGDGTEVKPAKVQVKTKNASMYLMGLSKTGTQVTIDVTKCRRIEFSSMIAPNESSGPVPAK